MNPILFYLFLLFHKIFFYQKHKESIHHWLKYAKACRPEKIFWNKQKRQFGMGWNYETWERNFQEGKSYFIPSFLQ